jgi:hypothetical protein
VAIRLDHLMWGAPSLEVGMAEAERLFGVAPAPGGSHQGLGTCNALLSLGQAPSGQAVYLEVIAPDPEQDVTDNLAGRLATLDEPGLITWAASAPALQELAGRAAALELVVRGPIPTRRATPDGGMLEWELLFLGGHRFGPLVPFFIDWLESPHPATTNPLAGTFGRLEIRSPEASALNDVFDGLGIDARAEQADEPGLAAHIETGRGTVTLQSAPEARSWTL